jgi:hypothetical protein
VLEWQEKLYVVSVTVVTPVISYELLCIINVAGDKLQTEMTIGARALHFMTVIICLSLLQHAVISASVPGVIKLPSEQHEVKSDNRKVNGVNHIADEEVAINSRPLIGILSQPGDGMTWTVTGRQMKEPVPSDYKESYIAASYVKFVESGGARAVPLIYNEPEEVLKKVCPLIPYCFSLVPTLLLCV